MSTVWIVRNQIQSYEYNLDCAKITNQNHEYNLECVFFHKPEPCVLFGPLVLFSIEEYLDIDQNNTEQLTE